MDRVIKGAYMTPLEVCHRARRLIDRVVVEGERVKIGSKAANEEMAVASTPMWHRMK